jgi:threonine dehydrogenase-like Zn-dependent dehydrogenase
LINALEYGPKKVIAVDRVESRLELARKLGAEAFNDQTDREGMQYYLFTLPWVSVIG